MSDTTMRADPAEVEAIDAVIDAGTRRLTWLEFVGLFHRIKGAGIGDPWSYITDRDPEAGTLLRRPRKEVDARDHFARQMHGHTEVGVPFGRCDVVMDGRSGKYAVEIEPYSSYPNGVRQAVAYGVLTGHDPALAVYGDLSPQQARSLYTRVSPWVSLFLLNGDWYLVGSSDMAEQHWPGTMWAGKPAPSVRQSWLDALTRLSESERA